ncbi:YhgE/Pip domain-containing protein [Ectobacillus antri]|uniref:YhgE/Pip domain-containing protein n=1 Tax=Ectobacillus antri TaxID=2486280 RepID=A0ABT6H5Z0_9BACI|nr:YhgE/Pip domain-containing protein [Ectobacillus antri]MDG4656930.1 YhgE/Pip domain-containing protein [Ectobacillus antri]MDG5754032.1 YhgE/Pip domain-containing protein [Ectobacillus antri]
MKQIWNIYKTDWKNIRSTPVVMLLIAALIVLPSIYAMVNIQSVWDPYKHTSGILVAVVNEDEGAILKDKSIAIGNEVIENLKHNKKLGWIFVDRDQAAQGVEHGIYYASLRIPQDFSKRIVSFVEERPQKPEIIFTVNEKVNAIAPKIATSGATGITAQITASFVETVGNAIFSGFNKAGIELERELPTIQNAINRIFELEKDMPRIREMGETAIMLETKLPDVEKKAQKLLDLEAKIPVLQDIGARILQIEAKLPVIEDAGQTLLRIQEKWSEMERAAFLVTDMVKILQDLQNQIKEAIEQTKAAKDVQMTGKQEELEQLEQQVANIIVSVKTLNVSLTEKVKQTKQIVETAALFIQNDFPGVEQKIHQAADFVRQDLPQVEADMQRAVDIIRTRLPQMEEAIHSAAKLARTDLPVLDEKIHVAADHIRKFERETNLYEIIDVLKNNPKQESDFLANPIILQTKRLFPIPNYGSAMNPFYTMLALWVGATLLVSSLRVDVDEQEYKSYQVYFGRLFTFSTISVLQALCASLGNLFLLHVYTANTAAYILFSILLSLVFTVITYTLCSVFGNIGKGLAVILLVLQVSSSGGTFPVSMTSPFFQAINPFMPFTYAVSLLREVVGGVIWDIAVHDIFVLCLFIGICIMIALLLKKPISKRIRKTTEKAKETNLIP